jgi:hypothetical protein
LKVSDQIFMHSKCHAHPILLTIIALTLLGNEYKLCNFLHYFAILSCSYIYLSNFFWDQIPLIWYSIRVREQVFHLYSANVKVTVLNKSNTWLNSIL